jgi:hypothetical protein
MNATQLGTGPDQVQINGLPLPRALTLAIEEHRWRCPAESVLRRVFREKPVRAKLYDLTAMREENRGWREEKDPAFFGHLDDKKPPGDIDPGRSLILGMLGPHMPFALDYRVSVGEPRVLYLHSGGDRWITIASDIEQLLARLQLDERRDPR